MKVLETKLVDIEDITVGELLIRPIEEMKDNEDLKNLYGSIEAMGQLHPCFVRMNQDPENSGKGKYELIAGGRRYAVLRYAGVKIEVKVVEASDLEALELGLTENIQRKDPNQNQRDAQIYRTWKLGIKIGAYKNIKDMAEKIGMNKNTLGNIIYAGKIKEKPENKENKIIQDASTRNLVRTKPLAEYPKIRDKILDLEQKKAISANDVDEISTKIKKSIDAGLDKEVVVEAIDMSKKTNEEAETPKPEENKNRLEKTLDVLKESHPDVKKEIIKGNISLDEAKKINKIESQEGRKQVIDEVKKIDKKLETATKMYKDGKIEHIQERIKQQDEVKKTGNSSIRTKFDVDKDQVAIEEPYERKHERVFIEEYVRLDHDTTSTLGNYPVSEMMTKEGKKAVLEIIKKIYNSYRLILVQEGEIKDIEIIKRP